MAKPRLREHIPESEIKSYRVLSGLPIGTRSIKSEKNEDLVKFVNGEAVDMWSEILLVDEQGEKIARVGLTESEPPPTWSWLKLKPRTTFSPNETVLEAVRRVKKKVRYVIDKGTKTLWIISEKELAKYIPL